MSTGNGVISGTGPGGPSICCGNTEGGRVNHEFVLREAVANFRRIEHSRIEHVCRLPFADGEFGLLLCAETVEHLDDPRRPDRDLRRVGNEVPYLAPRSGS